MAWTDQCRVAFRANAEAKMWRGDIKSKKGLMAILADLSEESGIPQKTLWRWWNEEEKRRKEILKNEINGDGATTIENDSDKNDEANRDNRDKFDRPMCKKCEKRPAHLDGRTRRPVGRNSMYHGLCEPCRRAKMRIRQVDEGADKVRTDIISDDDMKKEVGPDVPDKFRQLWRNILAVSEGLQTWADGTMKPDTEDDKIAIRGIMASLPYLCMQAARVGVDLVKILETFEREKLFNTK